MSEISLEWFFQIPGLFITIGVLLILIALLVLIIGSSRAKNKKESMNDNLDHVTDPMETVNVIENNIAQNDIAVAEPITINSSNTIDSNVNNDFKNEINTVTEPVLVNNNDNIMPTDSVVPSIVTPVNINENINVAPMETVNIPNDNMVISEPIIKKSSEVIPEVRSDIMEPSPVLANSTIGLSDALIEPVKNNALNNNDSVLNEQINSEVVPTTMSPIFASEEPKTVEESPVEVVKFEPVFETMNNIETNEASIANVSEPIVEPIKPMESILLSENNITDSTYIKPMVENVSMDKVPTENSDIEEIL